MPKFEELLKPGNTQASLEAQAHSMTDSEAAKRVQEGRKALTRVQDGLKGVYHVNAVDIVTQWEVVASVERIRSFQRKRA